MEKNHTHEDSRSGKARWVGVLVGLLGALALIVLAGVLIAHTLA